MPMAIADLITAARGQRPVDLLLTDARIVNVFNGSIDAGSVAVADGCVVGIGDYQAHHTVSLVGRFLAPGFIDSHVHIESAMTSVSEFVRAVLPLGTTTVVADPHEIANVLGLGGIEAMLAAAEQQPMNIYYGLPSCVPATAMETAGAVLDAATLAPLLANERILALGEMMNFPGLLACDPDVLAKIEATHERRKPVDGHCPGLAGKELAAYVAAGISSDHECISAAEAREKLAMGMHIMIREGTGAKNLADLLPIITPQTESFLMWCTDDRHPGDICREGHINYLVRRAVQGGIDPLTAIRMATIHPARRFGLTHLGAIAPGRRADLLVLPDLESFVPTAVYSGGRLVAQAGKMRPEIPSPPVMECPPTMRVRTDSLDLAIGATGTTGQVIELVPGQVVTGRRTVRLTCRDGLAVADPERDLLKLVVVERHRATGNVGKGFVSGFGLRTGALASSVAHDSHNIVAVGVSDRDLRQAIDAVIGLGGGQVVVAGGRLVASLALPLAGLMAVLPLDQVRQRIEELTAAARTIGAVPGDPFMALSFLALPVIPELKLTDQGLFDVTRFCHVPLFTD
ncbi:Adenine deaminase [Desulfofustis glycolicus DSM 9705]|uniref:Adenine deaminase n=2 Tax=Desulfofustis glycolicus TaxID=51195 RepID=A0A1M5S1S4_9BACT|nr:Adenine deaminase [Desulfofustis glycolicus DSM 9705]